MAALLLACLALGFGAFAVLCLGAPPWSGPVIGAAVALGCQHAAPRLAPVLEPALGAGDIPLGAGDRMAGRGRRRAGPPPRCSRSCCSTLALAYPLALPYPAADHRRAGPGLPAPPAGPPALRALRRRRGARRAGPRSGHRRGGAQARPGRRAAVLRQPRPMGRRHHHGPALRDASSAPAAARSRPCSCCWWRSPPWPGCRVVERGPRLVSWSAADPPRRALPARAAAALTSTSSTCRSSARSCSRWPATGVARLAGPRASTRSAGAGDPGSPWRAGGAGAGLDGGRGAPEPR